MTVEAADVLLQETLDWAADLLRRNGCTVLTPEEARALIDMAIEECITPDGSAALERALLSPNEASDE